MAKSVYEMVTERIISQLENGVIPWEKPWTGIRSGAYNRVSKKSYSLLNQMLLKFDGEYATFKQWQDLGGHIRKGEKSEIVVFWKIQPIEEEKEDGTKEVKQIPLLRYFNVFHISQVDGIEPLQADDLNDIEPIEKAESILHDYWNREDIEIEHTASNDAYYSPSRDLIHLPLFEQINYPGASTQALCSGFYVARSQYLPFALASQDQKRGMEVSLFLSLHIIKYTYLSLWLFVLE